MKHRRLSIILINCHSERAKRVEESIKQKYMFENLSERLERSFKILKGEGKITEVNISEAMKDIRRALLDADVSYKIAKQFCDDVK